MVSENYRMKLKKNGSIMFLRVVIFLMGLGVIALCMFLFPWLANVGSIRPEFASLRYVLIGAYASVIPFFIALYQGLKLLSSIDKNTAFSESSVKALKNIQNSAIAISIVYTMEFPFLFSLADADDAPGLVVIGLVIVFASLVIAVFATVLRKLFQNALEIKSENELTV